MENNNNHKGTELNNVKETWDQNEKKLGDASPGNLPSMPVEETKPTTELERLVKQEASEYDNTSMEDRILGGDRATVNDEEIE